MAVELPEHLERLPYQKPASIKIRAPLAKVARIGTEALEMTSKENVSHQELIKNSRFSYDSRSSTFPIRLTSLSECLEIYDDDRKVIGFPSLGTGDPIPLEQPYCEHIAALRDEIIDATNKEFVLTDTERVEREDLTAKWMAEQSASSMTPLNPLYSPILIPRPPILAYALVIRPTRKAPDMYSRVRIAEVNYDCMSRDSKSTIMLV
jgi:hypothetical protein